MKSKNYNKSYYILNISLIVIFSILILNTYKISIHNSHLQELAARSQFQSRVSLKISVALLNARVHLTRYLMERNIDDIYVAEEKMQSASANMGALLSYQALLNSTHSSDRLEIQINEIYANIEELLVDEKLIPQKKDLIQSIILSLDKLALEFQEEESSIWFRESQNLREYARLKDSSKFLFYTLTAGFIIAQMLMLYYSILRSKLIKKINLQNEQIIQQTRLSTVGLMSAELAHEINSPLMVIDGRLKIIESSFPKDKIESEKISRNLEIIKRNSNRIHSIIKSFKTMANDGGNDSHEAFSINSLFEEIHEIVQSRSIIKKISITFKREINSPIINANKIQIVQIVTNLVSNSIDAIKNLDERWINISYELHDEDSLIKILVTDSGSGVEIENQAKIFQSFYSTKSSAEGTGLGLSISKKIAIEHGGDLYYNADSSNTQFVLVLPYNKKAQS